jgi:hypothetical protein
MLPTAIDLQREVSEASKSPSAAIGAELIILQSIDYSHHHCDIALFCILCSNSRQ